MDPVALLAEYVRIDTSNPPGDCRAAAELLCRVLIENNLTPITFGATPEKPNVLCHVGGTEDPGLVLIHHMDVVPARAEEWSVPPFSAQVKDGYLYGRGTLDTKGLGVAHLCAAIGAARSGILRRKLFFVANADEEVGGKEGAEYFVRHLPLSFGRAVGMNEGGVGVRDLFGEGKFFLVNLWEKGPLWLALSAEGRAGHGSRPSKSDAPARLSRAMARIAEHRDPARLTEPMREMLRVLHALGRVGLDPDALPGGPEGTARLEEFAAAHPEIDPLLRNTFAVTTLSAGFKPNVIPAKAEGTVDCRILPGEEPGEVASRVEDLVRDLSVRVEVAFAEEPNGSPRGPLFEALSRAIRSVHPEAVVLPYLATGFTDSRFFRSLGVDTYGLMPLLLPREEFGRIHGVDERIPLAGIDDMVTVVSRLIEEWNARGGENARREPPR
ncbi:MAG TPA: M20/M25/M40 family metallo-hydrolase [Candidatus Deferrimicrobiaceae bacterium]|nr:M20/M25/M40 family metallo-hydrolase [Candidatus Deferrimicrobiaceae bacterium]